LLGSLGEKFGFHNQWDIREGSFAQALEITLRIRTQSKARIKERTYGSGKIDDRDFAVSALL
jgi:hypothetical protein